jgi:asparagine synthase (glutamine-hydrolysing)
LVGGVTEGRIASLYAQHGLAFAEHLHGDYAIALFDRKAQRLILARDPLGTRRLYWADGPRFFAFGADDEAIAQIDGISDRPDLTQIGALMVNEAGADIERVDWLAGVRLVGPGETVVIDVLSRSVRTHNHWSLKVVFCGRRPELREIGSEFDRLWRQAVSRRLPRVDPAIMMSGGIDSASIAAAASELLHGSRWVAYSAVRSGDTACAETRRIRAMQRVLSACPRQVDVSNLDASLRASLERLYVCAPHPSVISLSVLALMTELAAKDSRFCLLAGPSGDACSEVTESYLRHYLAATGVFATWKEAVRAGKNHPFLRGRRPAFLFLAAVGGRLAGKALTRLRQGVWLNSVYRSDALQDVSDRFRMATDIDGLLQRRASRLERESPYRFDQVRAQALWPLGIAHGLEAYQRIGARSGVRIEDPYADLDLVEFFLGLPVDVLVHGGWTKSVVRGWLSGRLPEEVVWSRDKAHVGGALCEHQLVAAHSAIQSLSAADRSRLLEIGQLVLSARAWQILTHWVRTGDLRAPTEARWRWVNYYLSLLVWLARRRDLPL